MKKYAGLAIVIFALAVVGAWSAYAASRMDVSGGSSQRVIAQVLSVSGDTVTLYYGGASDKKAFCENENLPIFTQNVLEGNVSLVGEANITRVISPRYAEARIVTGSADLGNISSKPSAMCMKG
jgi:hypothetical protein